MSSEDRTIVAAVGDVQKGTELNGIYRIDEKIAIGGMGEVYRGHNIQTKDLVAIKIVLPEYAQDETILALFRKEASVLNHLSHDAIVRYHVFSIDAGIARPYLAMEYVHGESLAQRAGRAPLTRDETVLLIRHLASGLQAAHDAGVIHRDLSPDNIIISGGDVARAKIIDFGIAKSAQVGGRTVLGGKFAGKYNFVSPEQLGLFGGEVTAKSDIYSLGLVAVAALRGSPVDMSGTQVDVIEKRRHVPDLRDIDPDLLPLLSAMLQPNPDDRPAGVAEISSWLETLPLVKANNLSGDLAQRQVPEAGGETVLGEGPLPILDLDRPPTIARNTRSAQDLAPSSPRTLAAKAPRLPASVTPSRPGKRRNRLVVLLTLLIVVVAAGAGATYYYSLIATGQKHVAAPETRPRLVPSTPKQRQESDRNAPAPDAGSTAAALDTVRNFNGGHCFYASAAEAGETNIAIEGYGSDLEPFQDLKSLVIDKHGIEPEMGVHRIVNGQCDVTDFLAETGSNAKFKPAFDLKQDRIGSGDLLSGSVSGFGDRPLSLFLIDDEGVVYNLQAHLKRVGDEAEFELKIVDLARRGPAPQLLLTVAISSSVESLQIGEPKFAKDFFPELLKDIRNSTGDIGAAITHFKLGE